MLNTGADSEAAGSAQGGVERGGRAAGGVMVALRRRGPNPVPVLQLQYVVVRTGHDDLCEKLVLVKSALVQWG